MGLHSEAQLDQKFIAFVKLLNLYLNHFPSVLMRFLLTLWHRLFPRFQPHGTWGDAVRVTDYAALNRLYRIYAEQVAWCRARGIAIQSPDCRVTLRLWPEHLRSPKDFEGLWGKVLSPYVIPDDAGGTLLLREALKDNVNLIAHETRHAITGESGHPDWLYPNG